MRGEGGEGRAKFIGIFSTNAHGFRSLGGERAPVVTRVTTRTILAFSVERGSDQSVGRFGDLALGGSARERETGSGRTRFRSVLAKTIWHGSYGAAEGSAEELQSRRAAELAAERTSKKGPR